MNKENIAGLLSFIGGIAWLLFGLFILINQKIKDYESFLVLCGLIVTSLAAILYPLFTRFGKKQETELDKINFENQLLQKQIEQKELKKKLESNF